MEQELCAVNCYPRPVEAFPKTRSSDGMTVPTNNTNQLVEELRAALAARDEFTAIAAHELRNPMTPILAQTQRLVARARREQCSAELISSLELLEFAVNHYIRRATTLLEISRINAGQRQLHPEPFDLAQLVSDCTRNYQFLAARADTPLQWTEAEPVTGIWDKLAIEQVLDNLVSNAIRYGDGKPVDIQLSSDEHTATLRVIDHGIGIACQDQQRIFQRFEQATGARTRGGGFGVGLWLARELVEAHSGSLELQSEPRNGSTFIVRLPRKAVVTSGEAAFE